MHTRISKQVKETLWFSNFFLYFIKRSQLLKNKIISKVFHGQKKVVLMGSYEIYDCKSKLYKEGQEILMSSFCFGLKNGKNRVFSILGIFIEVLMHSIKKNFYNRHTTCMYIDMQFYC